MAILKYLPTTRVTTTKKKFSFSMNPILHVVFGKIELQYLIATKYKNRMLRKLVNKARGWVLVETPSVQSLQRLDVIGLRVDFRLHAMDDKHSLIHPSCSQHFPSNFALMIFFKRFTPPTNQQISTSSWKVDSSSRGTRRVLVTRDSCVELKKRKQPLKHVSYFFLMKTYQDNRKIRYYVTQG